MLLYRVVDKSIPIKQSVIQSVNQSNQAHLLKAMMTLQLQLPLKRTHEFKRRQKDQKKRPDLNTQGLDPRVTQGLVARQASRRSRAVESVRALWVLGIISRVI